MEALLFAEGFCVVCEGYTRIKAFIFLMWSDLQGEDFRISYCKSYDVRFFFLKV